MTERIDNFQPSPFLDGPAEFLVKSIRDQLLKVPQWVKIFGDEMDIYKRMDYGLRALPAIRIYVDRYTKQFESWFEVGTITMDIIFPASIRRDELETLQSQVSSAMIQQLRSTPFFNAVSQAVPGLNELGKTVDVNKEMGFEWGEEVAPLTQLTVNFRLDLRQWDNYLESQDRTVDEPFIRTLADLEKIVVYIQALNDDGTVNNTIESDQQQL